MSIQQGQGPLPRPAAGQWSRGPNRAEQSDTQEEGEVARLRRQDPRLLLAPEHMGATVLHWVWHHCDLPVNGEVTKTGVGPSYDVQGQPPGLCHVAQDPSSNLLRSGKDVFMPIEASFQLNGAAHSQFGILLGMGVFKYEHLDSWDKMTDTTLPAGSGFFSKFNKEPCTEAVYARQAMCGKHSTSPLLTSTGSCKEKQTWSSWRISSRASVLFVGELRPAPSARRETAEVILACNAARHQMHVGPHLWSRNVLMVDDGIPGGVSKIATRHAQAKNPCMMPFDTSPARFYNIYIEGTSLPVSAMSRPVLIVGSAWRTPAATREIDWLEQTEDQPLMYFNKASIH